MNEDKIKRILIKTLEDNGIELWETGYNKFNSDPIPLARIDKDAECGFLAKQIADLYKPPEEVLLSDEERTHIYNELRLDYPSCNLPQHRCKVCLSILNKLKPTAKLYYEPKGDGEGLLEDEEIKFHHKCYTDESHKHWFYTPKQIAKAQKRLDDINKEKEIKRILDASEGTVQKIFDEMDKLKAQHQKEIEGIIV